MGQSRARVGLIIPSSNTFSEPQFNRFAPAGLDIHVTRARIAGKWKRPLPEMADEIAAAAKLLSDCAPNVIVFHCTETSMTQGPQGEGKILDIIHDATGVEAMATSQLAREALQTLGMKKVVLLTPYESNENIIGYLQASGIDVVSDIALALEPGHFGRMDRACEGA
jgi:maleate cis-trans isomerase